MRSPIYTAYRMREGTLSLADVAWEGNEVISWQTETTVQQR